MKKRKIYMVVCTLIILLGAISTIKNIVALCKIPYKTITVRIWKSFITKQFFGKILIKTANNIWVLGKNNLDWLERLPVASDTDKRSNLQFRIADKTEAVQL